MNQIRTPLISTALDSMLNRDRQSFSLCVLYSQCSLPSNTLLIDSPYSLSINSTFT